MIHLTLAVVFACALAVPARAQYYGGASSSDLLGYRSSAGHYYGRSLGSKVRSNAARRRGQPPPRPATAKSGPLSSPNKTPVSTPRASAGPTTFQPVAPMLAPRQLAAKASAEQKEVEKFYSELLEDYKALARRKGLPQNDVARAASFALAVSHDVYSGEGRELGQRQLEGLREQMREVLSEDADFQRLSDREKQELFEGYAILGMYISTLYDGARRANHQKGIEQLRQMARTHLEETFGVPVERVTFTDAGVDYK
ncbi:MAG: DUF6683 family protein [Pyrinomonadaceae bacterium]